MQYVKQWNQRAIEMHYLYESGMTLQGIGDLFEITRERVRQILARKFGASRRTKPKKEGIVPIPYNTKIQNKILSKVRIDPLTSCWNYLGAIHKNTGYAKISYKGRSCYGHRVSYQAFNNEVLERNKKISSETICVLHRCDNRKCVNPEHLYLGTQEDNAKDRDRRKENNIYLF